MLSSKRKRLKRIVRYVQVEVGQQIFCDGLISSVTITKMYCEEY